MLHNIKEITIASQDNISFSDNKSLNILPFYTIEDKDNFGQSNYTLDYFNPFYNKEIIENSVYKIDEMKTSEIYFKNDSSQNDTQKNEEKKYKIPDFYCLDNIKEKFGNLFTGISQDLFKKDQKIIEAENELQLFIKKNWKNDSPQINNGDITINKKYNRGRKKRVDESERKHGKYSSDNIMKKIKGLLFKNLIIFINKVLQKDEFIKELNFKKYINHLRKKENLKYLHLPIKDLLSLEISPFNRHLDANSNKINIKKILKEEKNNEAIMYILNLKFKEWIDIFTMKNDLKCVKGYEIIKNNLPKINDLLKKVLEKNDEEYLRLLLLYLYNYERWFVIRSSRRIKIKME